MADPKTSPARGAFYRSLGILLLAVGLAMHVVVVNLNSGRLPIEVPNELVWALDIGKIVLIVVGVLLMIRGGKLKSIPAADVLAQDTRSPILYLRSFADDVAEEKSQFRWVWFVPWVALRTQEEHLAGVMNKVGPFVAVGRPGERLPKIGAARMYIPDNEWQSKIGELLKKSRLVVLRAGRTEGLHWEFSQVVQQLKPLQLLIMFPAQKSKKIYQQFREWANEILPKPLPEGRPKAGFLTFDVDWTPVPLRPQHRLRQFFATGAFSAGDCFVYLLAPFFQQNDIVPPKPKKAFRLWLVLLLGLAPFILMMLIILLLTR